MCHVSVYHCVCCIVCPSAECKLSAIWCFFAVMLFTSWFVYNTISNVVGVLHCVQKSSTPNSWRWLYQLLTDFKYFSLLERELNFQQYFPPYLQYVAEVMMGSIIWILLEIYFSSQGLKSFENALRIDKVITMSLVYYFLGHSVDMIKD